MVDNYKGKNDRRHDTLQQDFDGVEEILLRAKQVAGAREYFQLETVDDLTRDEYAQLAIANAISQIGEQGDRFTAEFYDLFPGHNWESMNKMRHRIVHEYGRTNWNIVWDTMVTDIPVLINEIERFILPYKDDLIQQELNEQHRYDENPFEL